MAADLLLCREVVLSRHVYVPGTSGRLTTMPRRLGVGAKGGLERLRWRDWGRFQTWARGWYTIAGFIGEPNSGYSGPVRVRFYARKTCRGGKRVYSWRPSASRKASPLPGRESSTSPTSCRRRR